MRFDAFGRAAKMGISVRAPTDLGGEGGGALWLPCPKNIYVTPEYVRVQWNRDANALKLHEKQNRSQRSHLRELLWFPPKNSSIESLLTQWKRKRSSSHGTWYGVRSATFLFQDAPFGRGLYSTRASRYTREFLITKRGIARRTSKESSFGYRRLVAYKRLFSEPLQKPKSWSSFVIL